MSRLWKSIRPLVYDGDWHLRLMNALNLAEKEAISLELQASIKALQQLLLLNEECLQRVTVTKPLPKGMDYKFACEHVRAACREGEEVNFHPGDPTQIAMTVVMRGSLSYVSSRVDVIVKNGLRSAIMDFSRTD